MPTLELVFCVEGSLLQDFGFTVKVCNGKLPVLVFNLSRILELYLYSDFNKYRVNSQYYIVNTCCLVNLTLCLKCQLVVLCCRWQLQFLKSEFRGQLPQPYSFLPHATSTIPPHMNDESREEPSRYVSVICVIMDVHMDMFLFFDKA